jgi:hypothetical protein
MSQGKIHLLGQVQVIDVTTGEIKETSQHAAMLLPPAPGRCQACAAEHEAHLPHDRQSFYYQMAFRAEHGRSPTWADAMAHCTLAMQELWRQELRRRGVKEAELGVVAGQN